VENLAQFSKVWQYAPRSISKEKGGIKSAYSIQEPTFLGMLNLRYFRGPVMTAMVNHWGNFERT